ncbi:phosphotransferase [Sphaerisporangium sp. NPDC005289]|uniref:phosphotransferase n=1 Tax=Sphaerisporangium sp. NPDC005289 TaxID=3155247 RepID=UPI0033BEA4FA
MAFGSRRGRTIAPDKHQDDFDQRVTELLEQRKLLIEKYADLRSADEVPLGPFGWTHGDFQHLNVMWQGGKVVAVLDWDRIRVPPFQYLRAGGPEGGMADKARRLSRLS